MKISSILALLTFSCFLFSGLSYGKTGLEVAREMEKRNKGFIGESSRMTMVLITADGEKIERKMQGKTLEVNATDAKSLLSFLKPLDIKGTKMLTWSYETKDSDQWLFLPSLRRVKRISGSGKMASFMGSEFTYEDLSGAHIENYNYKLLKEQKSNDDIIYHLERISKKKSGYSKVIIELSHKYAAPLKADYYDRKGQLLKSATQSNFAEYIVNGKKFWRPKMIHMKNKQTKKESKFIWDNRKMGIKIKEKDLHKRALK